MTKKKKFNIQKIKNPKELEIEQNHDLINEPYTEYISTEEKLSPEAEERYKRMVRELEEEIRLGKAKKYTDIEDLKNDLRAGI